MTERSEHSPASIAKHLFFVGLTTAALSVFVNLPCLYCFGNHSDVPDDNNDVTIWILNKSDGAAELNGAFVDPDAPELGILEDGGLTLYWKRGPFKKVLWEYQDYESIIKVTRFRHQIIRVYVRRVSLFEEGIRVFEIDIESLEQRDYARDCPYGNQYGM